MESSSVDGIRHVVEARADSRRDVDRELAAVYDVLCAFKTRRNALASISRLPPEVLSRIFSIHAINQPPGSDNYVWDDKDEEADPPSMSQVQLGWITVTHVCRHWRQLALDQPCLWTEICFALGNRWVEEMLVRSRAAPIVFERDIPPALSPRNAQHAVPADAGTRPPPDEKTMLAGHMSHIQQLKLRAPYATMQRLVKSFTGPAPLLEGLSLTSLASIEALTLPFALFATHTPRLRRVLLNGFRFLWSSSLFHGLEHLHVTSPVNLSNPASGAPPQPGSGPDAVAPETADSASTTLSRFLDVLRNLPHLQSLVLKNCLPDRLDPPGDVPAAPLPHLSLLGLEGTVHDCTRLLRHLVLPSSTALDLHCSTRLPTDVEFHHLLDWVASHLRLGAGPEPANAEGVQTLVLSSTSLPPTLHATGWNACLVTENLASYALEATPAIELALAWPAAVPIPQDLSVVQRIVRALPLHKLRALAVTMGHRVWSEDEGAEIVRGCPSVEHLLGKGSAGLALSRAIASAEPPFPLLNLVSFTLVAVDLMAAYDRDLPYQYDAGGALAEVLKKRRAAGVGLKLLKIAECAVSPLQIGWLKAVAQMVQWDEWGRAAYSRMDAGLWLFGF
ncbi:hypothetical protein OF83DRAFT_1151684 [Amylostereum chailletii]|nr:hypothetical protein OF83DRAFT_1151684 [Amylostereum chailletii]